MGCLSSIHFSTKLSIELNQGKAEGVLEYAPTILEWREYYICTEKHTLWTQDN